jgi:predicted  nucleic acid-binding Zn-ribbon protein
MLRHFEKVKKRLDRINKAKLKLGGFKLALDELNHYSKIEKEAGQALTYALKSKKSILSQSRSLNSQYNSGQVDKRHFSEQRRAWTDELTELNHEIKKMSKLDKAVHPELKKAMKDFRRFFKNFKRILRT